MLRTTPTHRITTVTHDDTNDIVRGYILPLYQGGTVLGAKDEIEEFTRNLVKGRQASRHGKNDCAYVVWNDGTADFSGGGGPGLRHGSSVDGEHFDVIQWRTSLEQQILQGHQG